MLLLFWTAGPSAAAPSITLSLAPVARVTLFTAQATPSIRLSMVATANPQAQATPSITLALAPVARSALGAQATPSITLAMATVALGIRPASASPSVTLALGPVAQQTHMARAAPSIRLALEVHSIGGITVAGGTVIELEYNAAGSTVTIDQRIAVGQVGVSTLILSVRE